MRQRVAFLRTLMAGRPVLLLDEPFASLDAGLRLTLREEVVAILRRAGSSALLVTHDQEEALSLADRVAVMRDGEVLQSGPPDEVYASPHSRWIAEFLGDAEILSGTASDGSVECELGRLHTIDATRGAVDVVVRPEALTLSTQNGNGAGVPARVIGRSFFGHDQIIELELTSGRTVRSRSSGIVSWHVGDDVRIRVEGAVATLAPIHSTEG
jgi:iron(III) transport system ATP-binding protein